MDKPADLDVATVMAMGFPAPRGGLIFWADLLGADRICKRLDEWSRTFHAVGLGGFFQPCNYLKRCADTNRKLESGKEAMSKL